MIRVKIHCGWRDDQKSIREHFNKFAKSPYTWNDIYLVPPENEDYDYIVILNYPRVWLEYDKKKAIIFQLEPDIRRKKWGQFYLPSNDEFFRAFVIDPDRCVPGWNVRKTYNELMVEKIEKTKGFSAVVSGLTILEGHKDRLDFCLNYLSKIDCYDHYGRKCPDFRSYRGPIGDKKDALFPYKYTFAAENTYEDGYFTGKITDSIVSECLCFYSGCPNLSKYFDPRSFIQLDLSDKEKSLKIVKEAIENNEYEKRLPYILKQKKVFLNKMQPLPLIESIIKEGR